MNKLALSIITIITFSFFSAQADLRKDPKNHKAAKELVKHIYKTAPDTKNGKKIVGELMDICTKAIHKGCAVWEKSGKFYFQELNNKGRKDGKEYKFDSWVKKHI